MVRRGSLHGNAAPATYRDDTTGVISVDEWKEMGRMMTPHVP